MPQLLSACAGAEIPRRPKLSVAVTIATAILRAMFMIPLHLLREPHGRPGAPSLVAGGARTRRNGCLKIVHCTFLQAPPRMIRGIAVRPANGVSSRAREAGAGAASGLSPVAARKPAGDTGPRTRLGA